MLKVRSKKRTSHGQDADYRLAAALAEIRLLTAVRRLVAKAASGEVDPLCDYLLSGKSLSEEDRIDVAWALHMLCRRGRRPLGPVNEDVARAEDKAAHLVARRRDKWLIEHPERQRLTKGLSKDYAKQAIEQSKVAPAVKAKMTIKGILIRLSKIRREVA